MGSGAGQSRGWWRCACAYGALALLGCGERDPACRGPRCEELDVHVLTWWPDTANSPIVPLMLAAEERPDVRDVLPREHNSKQAMMTAVERLLLGAEDGAEPVDTFLANAGRDVRRWTPCESADGLPHLLRLDAEGAYPELRASFDPAVLQGLTCCASGDDCSQPGIYALPLGLHRINHIFFNVERFAQCTEHEVRDWASLIGLLGCLKSAGKRVISVPASDCDEPCKLDASECLSCRGATGESLSYLLESLALVPGAPLAAQDAAAPDAAAPLSAAQSLLENALLSFVNNDCTQEGCKPPSDHNQALKEVMMGDAAFLVMPDWYTQDAQRHSHGAVEPAPFPGTDETYLFMTDVFAVPLAGTPGASVEAAFRWLNTLLEDGVQQSFAAQKTALPALADHSQRRLVLSLEGRLPVDVDPAEVRARLNDELWRLQKPVDMPATPEPTEPQPGEENAGSLPVIPPCAGWPCDAPCASSPCGDR